MESNLNEALEKIKSKSSNTVEQGTAFEKLAKIYFENDDIQKQEFNKIWFYKDWAKENPSFSKIDIGIDLIGELKDNRGLAAIQCKFFNPNYQITKEDLDSFISASSNKIFSRLILIDTSNEDLGSNAKSMVDNLNKTYQRIQKYNLENSRINWLEYINNEKISLSKKKDPLDHQIKAIQEAKKYFSKNDRGKMIMACGTGKTFTSLKIAEAIANKKLILYMVPSLALMSQSIREWKNDCVEDFIAFSACSDKKVGKVKDNNDQIQIKLNELAIPATTESEKLAEEINRVEKNKMVVVFSTYQSIDVIAEAQKKFSLNSFDLIICDEAHRTTGATFEDQEDSYFVRIHDNKYVKGKKRLYMTATPRIFGSKAKKKADEGSVELASMDDPEKFGEEFFNRGFNWAVENNLLSDYKVVILAVDEALVSSNLQKSLEDGSELKLTDATKIIGVYKALAKVGFDNKKNEKLKPIRKALAFTQSIEISKIFEKEFSNVINEYEKNENIKKINKLDLNVEAKHIDGTFNAERRNDSLNWLKSKTEENTCRILSNVKCLSEGVDVPSLDAIMFLHPKKSQIDVVQAVGRVMRVAEGKDMGYVIIPVTVAPGVSPEKALNDNEKYRVVWQIVNALRTHDERLDSKINMLSLGEDVSDKIEIISMSAEQDATTAKVEDVKKKKSKKTNDNDDVIKIDEDNLDNQDENDTKENQMSFELDDLSQAIKAKIVQKCGTRDYWENWAADIAKIAQTHITRINSIVLKSKSKERQIFLSFLKELQDDLNPDVNEIDAIEMLAQHIITKPVFEILFSGSNFIKENAISKAMQKILDIIYKTNIEIENKSLDKFYSSVKRRAAGIVTAKSKNKLINELYERFFKNAFPVTTKKLGIVYTPTEIVDFMIHSMNDLSVKFFDKSLGMKNVHILDPFSGTGTFISRLIQSDLIEKKNLLYKYKNELHANEIVLLAYYIANINIETAFQSIMTSNSYQSFDGMVLTDTFQLYEQDRDMIADLLPDNSNRRTKQKKSNIRIIMGNPPYSIGQNRENENAANISYPNLDFKIEKEYSDNSNARLKKGLYDNYIRAFRWASDRLNDNGIIGFVTNGGWLEAIGMDGFRNSLAKEFCSIYAINLRGNKRTQGETAKKEGGPIFSQGSRNTICITFLVKNKSLQNESKIFYYDIGDYLTTKQKLEKINQLESIKTLIKTDKLTLITPNKKNEWLNQSSKSFNNFKILGSKDKLKEIKVFNHFSQGILTSRDSWCINHSKKELTKNIKRLIDNYNILLDKTKNDRIDNNNFHKFIDSNLKNINWSANLKKLFLNKKKISFDKNKIRKIVYRPFNFKWAYYDKDLNERRYQISKIYPESDSENTCISIMGLGENKSFSTLITNLTPEFKTLYNGQHFPLFNYENYNFENENNENLFSSSKEKLLKKENICSDFKSDIEKFYKKKIKHEEIFYYIYGLLNSKEFIDKYQNNLNKELPRIPYVKSFNDFLNFSKIGKELANLLLNLEGDYKTECKVNINENQKIDMVELYRVTKMKHPIVNGKKDLSKIIYNQHITVSNIPLSAYNFMINEKSLIHWIIDKQKISNDSESGIKDDANDYANETVKNPAYPLELLKKVIFISLESQKLIKSLPALQIVYK